MLQRIKLAFLCSFFSVQLVAQVKVAPAQNGKPVVSQKTGNAQMNGKLVAPTTQNGKPTVTLTPQASPPPPKPLNFKKINDALSIAFIIDKPTSPKPVEGDVIRINMISACNNRMVYNSFQANKGKPVEFGVNKPGFKGDIIEAILMMTPGDSISCIADANAVFKASKNKMPDFIKSGDKIQYFIKLVSIKSKAQVQKEQQEAMNKQIQAQMAKQKIESEKLIGKEDKQLKEYFTKNNITPIKTASGLYYTITKEGSGDSPKMGDTITMNYTGKLLDGTIFDSNEDTSFHHVQPFIFNLQQGRVIKGWDEGVALLKKGSKAVFYIPSRLGYGAGQQAKIPANSILLFNVELADYKSFIKQN